MDNVGYAGLGWGQLFLFLILLPTMVNVIKYLFSLNNVVYVEPQEYTATSISYHIGDNVGGNKITNNVARKKPRAQRQPKPKNQPRIKKEPKNLNKAFGIIEAPETSTEIKENSALALKKLGFKISDAKKTIKKLCIKKCYHSEQELIMDVMGTINNG